jgi:hypothetical protein
MMFPQDVTNAGTWDTAVSAPTNLNVLVIDPDHFGDYIGVGDDSIYKRSFGKITTSSSDSNWLFDMQSALSYIGCMYAFARGSRVYGIQSNPSNVVNATKFARLADETDPTADSGTGTYEFKLTSLAESDSPPRRPYFRPEDYLVGYNYVNTSSATLSATNYSYGFNMGLQNNIAVQKSGEQGCGLVVQVPPTSNLPYRLLVTSTTSEANYIARMDYSAPRSRRFLELRYKPFSTALSGGTSTLAPKMWPFPMTIMEAGADDFSFGGLVPPPQLTKIARTTMFANNSTGAKVFL